MPDRAQQRGRTVLGAHGMVASAHPQVSLVGAAALSSGGNAYDAALAMAGMAAVALPAMCGVGGDAFAVVHDGPNRTWTAYMGSGVGPDGADVGFFRDRGLSAIPIDGPLSVAVPGAVDCWDGIHRAGATRGLDELWSPAVAAARDGIAVTRRLHGEATEEAAKLQRDAVSHTVYLPGGAPPAVGSVLRQADLARTLQTIAASPRAFYEGALGERCVGALRLGGAPFSGEEWAAHRTLVGEPLRGAYGGTALHTTLPPSPGYMVAQQAAMLDGVLRDRDWLDADSVHLLASAARRAFADRWQHVGSEGDGWRALLRDDAIAGARASLLADAAPLRAPLGGGDTTCFVAADAQGTVVSMIQSVAFVWGSGVMVPGTGVLLNNRAGRGFYVDENHPNRVRPRVRPMHTLTVWALADDAGRPLVAGGTPGGDGQVQWNVQLISHLVDHGLGLQAAVEAPRFTVWPGSDADVVGSPPELRCEARLGATTLDALRARGHDVRVLGDWDGGGGAQLVALDREHGTLRGASDPRLDGCALAV
jgi:gamma-glutamyltranspeptidase / glutathione hydrolase